MVSLVMLDAVMDAMAVGPCHNDDESDVERELGNDEDATLASRFILVGDCDQLEPVCAPPVLPALLRASDLIPGMRVIKLTRVFRQGEGTASITRALAALRQPRDIRLQDLVPASGDDDGAFFIVVDDRFATRDAAVEFVQKAYDALEIDALGGRVGEDANASASAKEEIPTLAMRVLCFSVETRRTLNLAVQERRMGFGGDAFLNRARYPDIKIGDLVRCVRNLHEDAIKDDGGGKRKRRGPKRRIVTNGAIGVVRVGGGEPRVVYNVVDDRGQRATWTDRMKGDGSFASVFELGAYASTVHSAQGNEADVVIGLLDSAAFVRAARRLMYTLVSRAKKQVVVGCTRAAIDIVLRAPPVCRATELLVCDAAAATSL